MWKEQILDGKENGEIIAVNKWLARMTLDVLGQSTYLCRHNDTSFLFLISVHICVLQLPSSTISVRSMGRRTILRMHTTICSLTRRYIPAFRSRYFVKHGGICPTGCCALQCTYPHGKVCAFEELGLHTKRSQMCWLMMQWPRRTQSNLRRGKRT